MPTIRSREYSMREIIPVVLLGSIAVLLVIPETRAFLNTHEGAISVVLTTLLVLLYFRQYKIQDQQTTLENRPYVDIRHYKEEGKELKVWLSNTGNGVATNLEIEAKLDFKPQGSVAPVDGGQSARLRKIGNEGDPKKSVGSSLKPGEQKVLFVGEPKVRFEIDGHEQGYGLFTGTRMLGREGVETARLMFYVRNSDLLENEYQSSVYGRYAYEVNLEEGGFDMEEVKNRGRVVVQAISI